MSDHTPFESRLASALQRRADRAPIEVDAVAVAHVAAMAAVRPSAMPRVFGSSRWGTARLLLAAAVLTLLVAVAVVLATLLLSPAPVLGRLVPAGTMTVARGGQTATLLSDGRVLLVAGDVNGPDGNSAELYDPATDTFTRTGSISTLDRRDAASALLPDGRVLVVGGSGQITGDDDPAAFPFAEMYDPVRGTFSRTGPMIVPREQVGSTATLPDGRVVIAGGSGWNGPLGSIELFDPVTNTFVSGGAMVTSRSQHTMTLLSDGRVLLAGGSGTDFQPLATAEIYDPVTHTSVPTGDLGIARSRATATALADGRVLVVGGTGSGPGSPVLSSAELYDPTAHTFEPTGSLVTERWGASSVRLGDGRVLIVGGTNVDGSPSTTEVYDPVSGTFDAIGRLQPGQIDAVGQTATLLLDGSVLIAGRGTATAQRFDPSLSAESVQPAVAPVAPVGFAAVDGPGALRTGHTATRLADGRVLIAGGMDAGVGSVLASAEIFDPATGRSTPTGAMLTPRSGHLATLLSDGRVLIVGGLADADPTTSLPSAELYDPAMGTFSPAGVMTVARPRTHFRSFGGTPSAIPLPDGRVFIEGWDPSRTDGGSSSMEMYDPVAGTFTPIAWPTGPRLGQIHGADRLPDGRMLIITGPSPDTDEPALQATVYDPVSNAWQVAGTTSVRDRFTTTGLPDGRVLIAGGVAGGMDDSSLATAEIWDPIGGTFSATGDLAAGRTGHAATLLPDGRVLITGGQDYQYARGDGSVQRDDFPVPEIWDRATGAFGAAGTMAAQRSGHTATPLGDGRVLLVGGVTRSPDRTDPVPPFAELYLGQ